MLNDIAGTITGLALAALMSAPAQARVQISLAVPRIEIHVAHAAPPAIRVERISRRPDRRAVWVRGYWDWRGSDWVWVSGRWAYPDHRGYWVNARYVPEGSAWRYEPAHWSYEHIVEGNDYRDWRHDHDRGRHH